jgi:cysteinyl-tRNA synthetase
MSLDLLGEGFDLHTGGQDLRFPHHENERAQAVALGKRFANHWMHHAFVEVKGEKMSKSLGNATNLVDLLAEFDPRAFRLLILQSHYRSPMDITHEAMTDAQVAMGRLDTFARRALAKGVWEGEADQASVDRFRQVMDDDLDTPAATALVFGLVRQANTALDEGDAAAAGPLAAAVRELSEALGLVLQTAMAAIPDEITGLALARDGARANKDWAEADRLRDQITAAGYVVEDGPDGPTVRPAK